MRSLQLPLGHYVVTGSGPLAVRGLREAEDIDLQVDDELWADLEKRYGAPTDEKVMSLEEGIDAHRDTAYTPHEGARDLAEQIRNADLIDGVAFMSLADTRVAKRAQGREKDLADIRAIEAWEASSGR